jgi:serine/threonine protein kinase
MSPLLYNGLRTNQIDIKHNLFKSDVYSLGLCILYAATLNINYLYQIRKFIDMNTVKIFIYDLLQNRYSKKFIDLLSLMLEINENNRPDFLEMERIMNIWRI